MPTFFSTVPSSIFNLSLRSLSLKRFFWNSIEESGVFFSGDTEILPNISKDRSIGLTKAYLESYSKSRNNEGNEVNSEVYYEGIVYQEADLNGETSLFLNNPHIPRNLTMYSSEEAVSVAAGYCPWSSSSRKKFFSFSAGNTARDDSV